MSVTLVQEHVLLPHRPNWQEMPDWRRTWRTEVAGLDNENRTALRTQPLVQLKWRVSTRHLTELAELDDRIRAARQSGRACAPYWGRGSRLAADVTSTAVVLASSHWTWALGDYVFLMDAARDWDVRQISALSDQQHFTLSAAVTRTYSSGLAVWPLLFGKLVADSLPAETGQRGETALTLVEQVSPASATVGSVTPPGGSGIGAMIVGSTFTIT